MYIHICKYVYIHTHVHMYVYVHMYIYIYVYMQDVKDLIEEGVKPLSKADARHVVLTGEETQYTATH